MRARVPVQVEAGLAAAEFKAIAGGAAPCLSVRLKAPDGDFQIDPASHETQWLRVQPGLGDGDMTHWRWTVTPLRAGRRTLHLAVSAITTGPDGAGVETALPHQAIEVRVGRNYGRALLRLFGWVFLMALGGAMVKFGAAFYDPAIGALLKLLK
jgi:hypothetical protein